MSALTVTLGADTTALKRAMSGATELVSASAKRMGKLTGAGLAGVGKRIGFGLKVGLGTALAGGIGAAAMRVKSVGKAAEMEGFETALVPLPGEIEKL